MKLNWMHKKINFRNKKEARNKSVYQNKMRESKK